MSEMERAEEMQSVKQRIMSSLRSQDVLRALDSGVNKETLRKMFVYIFSENCNPDGKHALFSLDGHEVEIIQNLTADHELSWVINDRGLDPRRYVGGKFGLVIDGVEIKDEALAEEMFCKYFDAARLIAADEVEEGTMRTYRSPGEEDIKHDAYAKAAGLASKKLVARLGEYEGSGAVPGDYRMGEGKRAYETIAKSLIASSEDLRKEEILEKELSRLFLETEAKARKDAKDARIRAAEEKKYQETLEVAKNLL
jgi:hypothetical protein